jgi:predicted O-linked N-acetylglucosamine transferase (SPINDLY family)
MDIDKLLLINNNQNNISLLYFLIFLTTNFSAYYVTFDEFLEKRKKIKENLEYLLLKTLPICTLENISGIPVSNFFLSYQGLPSIDIFKLKSQLVRKICPELSFKIDTSFINKKVNVCFHSNFLSRKHSVFKDRHLVIKGLADSDEFNVYFTTFDDLTDVKYSFGKAKHIKLDTKLEEIKKKLIELKLDILVYCEIGMDPRAYFMAHLKLAKIQINTWGHSDSSGIDTIDYFISSKLYELPLKEAQTHYTEQLILQNSLCTAYLNPLSGYNISTFKDRYHYGFTDEVVIFFCAQSLFKFNPLFDNYLINILQANKNFILCISNNESKAEVIKRFNNKFITSQIHTFPMMQHSEYMNLINISDVILDPYPFGGCNSSLEAFSLNKVVVTHASKMINGRFTCGFYKKMGLDNIVTYSMTEYTKLAIKLGNDIKYRKKIENKIKAAQEFLFLDKQSVFEWASILKKLVVEF